MDPVERRWRDLVEQVPAVVYHADYALKAPLRYVSSHIERLLGHPPEAFLADQELWYELMHPDDRERVIAKECSAFEAGESFSCEFRMIAADGTERVVWDRDHVVHDADGTPTSLHGVLIDLTSLRRAEDAVREERDRAQLYLDAAGTLMLVIDEAGRVTLLNQAGHELLGYRDGELQGKDWFDAALADDEREEVRSLFAAAIAGHVDIEGSHENDVVTKDGERRTVQWHNVLLRGPDGTPTGVLASGTDVSERRIADEQIAYLAYHDTLTGLPNRALLREHLDLALARARREEFGVAVLYVDLDDFKLVNDSLGHRAGDQLLGHLALRLRSVTREADLLARQGGDEFLLLLSDVPGDTELAARAAAEKLLMALQRPFSVGEAEFQVGASIGIATFPSDATTADALLERADSAMYQAKSAGPGEIRVFSARDNPGVDRLSLTRRLRRAIERDELVLHWQPLVALGDGTVGGLEALVRWQDPDRGLLAPGAFVPAAEQTGLIEPLGEWVAGAVSAQRRSWRAEGLDPHVALNLSPRQLRRQDHLDRLLVALGIGELALDRVTIEVTEGALLREDTGVAARVQGLHDAGLTLALDDFGTAYSSLSRLREVPVRWVKVDRSFLEGVPADGEATAVLAAVLDLVAALGLESIVEGVEEPDQLAWLEARGVAVAQGYLLGRPVPAAELAERLRASPACRRADAAHTAAS